MQQIIDKQQRIAAKLAGISYLFTFAIVVSTNFAIYNKINVPNDAEQTVRNILSNEHLFRFGIIADLSYALGFIILLASLYMILKNTNALVAHVALFWHLIYIITWVVFTLKFLESIRLLTGVSNYLQVFTENQLFALSKLNLSARFDRYYGVLMFYSLCSMLFNILWFKSRFIPRLLSIWGIIACSWCTICAVTFIIYPDFEDIVNIWLFDLPMAFFDITLSFWLIIKGLKPVFEQQQTL